ncbi:MAG: hypothetical protein WCI41_00020 [bacterium]
MIKKNIQNQKGYSLIEMLFYISIFCALFIVVINSLIIMTKSFKQTSVNGELVQSGTIMEKISHEIKQAYDINSISSTSLVLNTKDASGNNKTVQFNSSGDDILFTDNGTLVGALNNPNIQISNLSFTQISTLQGKEVKIFFTVNAIDDAQNKTYDFYDTVILRGTY